MTSRPPTDVPGSSLHADREEPDAAGTATSRRDFGEAGTSTFAAWGRVLRGLSALFWGLPVSLVAFARHFLAVWPSAYDLVLPSVGALLLVYGVFRLGALHPYERIWQQALFASQTLGLVILGLSPFLYLWSRVPAEPLFARAVAVLLFASVLFLVAVTRVLARLAALLPDPAAQADAQLFHLLTGYVGLTLATAAGVFYWRMSPISLSEFLSLPQQPVAHGLQAFLLMLILIPIAMSMAVTWKLKEVVMAVLVGRGMASGR